MTSGSATRRHKEEHRQQVLEQIRHAEARRKNRIRLVVGVGVLVVVAAVVAGMMLTSRTTSTASATTAPAFTLTDTTGRTVSLADYRGRNVVLYFSEGAGCGSCLQQMAEIEKNKAGFAAADVTVLPIVMNTREQITGDMETYGVKTPFLLDDGTVSTAYKTIGRGMHAGLPGHSFVLVDSGGVQRWFGEYPSMWLAPQDLLAEIKKYL